MMLRAASSIGLPWPMMCSAALQAASKPQRHPRAPTSGTWPCAGRSPARRSGFSGPRENHRARVIRPTRVACAPMPAAATTGYAPYRPARHKPWAARPPCGRRGYGSPRRTRAIPPIAASYARPGPRITIRTDLYDTFLVGAPFLPIDRRRAHARQWPHARPVLFEQVVHAFINPVMLVVAEFVTPRQQMLA